MALTHHHARRQRSAPDPYRTGVLARDWERAAAHCTHAYSARYRQGGSGFREQQHAACTDAQWRATDAGAQPHASARPGSDRRAEGPPGIELPVALGVRKELATAPGVSGPAIPAQRADGRVQPHYARAF